MSIKSLFNNNGFKSLTEKAKGILVAVGGFFKKIGLKIWGFVKKHKILSVIIAIVLVFVIFNIVSAVRLSRMENDASAAVYAERRDIDETISGSTVIYPNAEYSVTPTVSGEILEAPFEEGDYLEKGDLMYKIDTEDIENSIASADLAVENAKRSYDDAVANYNNKNRSTASLQSSTESARIAVKRAEETYNDALKARDDLNVRATYSGVVETLNIHVGDTIAPGTVIAQVYDNERLKIEIPFNSSDADLINIGDSATLTLTDSGYQVYGTVVKKSQGTNSQSGYMVTRDITIEVSQPGAINEGDYATAMVGNIACNDVGTFEYATNESITAQASGKVNALYISEGDRVYSGETIAVLDGDDVESQITSAKLSLDDANEALRRAELQEEDNAVSTSNDDRTLLSNIETAKNNYEDALLSRDNLEKQLEDYTITAPISGTVAAKNYKVGDKIESGTSMASSYSSSGSGASSAGSSLAAASGASGSSASSSLASSSSAAAVIYDISALKCDLDVDEIDVKKVKNGQKVKITTDATDNEYHGVVENVGINGTVGSNGVTTYPVKIDIIDFDNNLLPGMNVDVEISIVSVEDALSVPVNALQKGNIVYVKGDKEDENDSAPDGYKSVEVVTGASDDDYIQIVSGLDEGEEVYVEGAKTLTPQEMMMQQMQGGGGGASGGGAPAGGGGF